MSLSIAQVTSERNEGEKRKESTTTIAREVDWSEKVSFIPETRGKGSRATKEKKKKKKRQKSTAFSSQRAAGISLLSVLLTTDKEQTE